MPATIDGATRVKIPDGSRDLTAQQPASSPGEHRLRPESANRATTRGTGGVAGVQDSKSAGRTLKIRAAAAQSQGEAFALPPPRPPTPELNEALHQGAESFIANVSLILDGLLRDGGLTPEPPVYGPPVFRAALGLLEEIPLPTAAAPLAAAAEALAASGDPVRPFSQVSAESLMALFLILNINDPNNSVETHQDLNELATNLRQQALDEAEAKAEVARELQQELESAIEQAQMVERVAQIGAVVLAVVLTVVISVVTAGAAAAPAAAASGAVGGGVGAAGGGGAATAGVSAQVAANLVAEAVTSTASGVAAAVEAAKQVYQASQTAEVQYASADVDEASNDVERARARAEREQEIIDDEAAIMKLIMESKSQTVDAFTKMLASQLETGMGVLSVGTGG